MDHFDELAKTWENPERLERAVRLAQEIRIAWGAPAPSSVLDFGAGTGVLSLQFIDDVDLLVAYDPSQGMREALAEKLVRLPQELADKVAILESLNDLPDGAQCDAVVTSQVLHHVEDVPAVIAELAELVVDDGSLTVIDFVAGDGFRHPGNHHDLPHHGFAPGDMAYWMRCAGFNDVITRTVYEGFHVSDGGEEHPYRLFLAIGRR